jgi:hypothetical protein
MLFMTNVSMDKNFIACIVWIFVIANTTTATTTTTALLKKEELVTL